MPAWTFYLGGAGLVALGALCIRNTAPHTRSGGSEYEWKQRRRLIGKILMVAAAVALVTGGITQFFSGTVPPDSALTDNDAVNPPLAPEKVPPAQSSPSQPAIPAMESSPSDTTSAPAASAAALPLLREAVDLLNRKMFNAAMDKVNAALQVDPHNTNAYDLRGNVYAAEKLWERAREDFATALQLDPKDRLAKFNLAEMNFMLKKYDDARAGFVTLRSEPDMGDLATYKTFLCDLSGGHEAVAAKELDALDQVGANASYYFANAAWSLYHDKRDDARDWLMTASRIYSPNKFQTYVASLVDLGYPGRLGENPAPNP